MRAHNLRMRELEPRSEGEMMTYWSGERRSGRGDWRVAAFGRGLEMEEEEAVVGRVEMLLTLGSSQPPWQEKSKMKKLCSHSLVS